jgi:hypothetical protein
VQLQRDEINHLKDEKGKPKILPNKQKSVNISSETERKNGTVRVYNGRQTRNYKVKITRTVECPVSPEILPPDAIKKGYTTVIIQDLKIEPDNIELLIEHYYSPSTNQTYSGKRPDGFEGEFGPGIKALVIFMKYGCNMAIKPIQEFLSNNGIFIATSTISRYLTKNIDQFHEEIQEVAYNGLISTTFQQLDDTSARVNGQQWYTQILCNPYYAIYNTIPHKDRLSVLNLLLGPHELNFLFNEESFELLDKLKVSSAIIAYLMDNCKGLLLSEQELDEYLIHIPTKNKALDKIYRRIKEASGIAWYHNQDEWPIIEILLTDDAPQFDHLALLHALCWIHAGRNLKKLNPLLPISQEILKDKLSQFWEFYHILSGYKENPDPDLISDLKIQFEGIFSHITGYQALDEKLKTILNNKDYLLLVLEFPEIPLHNNEAELGARVQVRRRDVSLHTLTSEGTKAADTFLSLKETTRKCEVNFFDYLYDRITKAKLIERLGETIFKKARIHKEEILN